jgi:hypothetical protein
MLTITLRQLFKDIGMKRLHTTKKLPNMLSNWKRSGFAKRGKLKRSVEPKTIVGRWTRTTPGSTVVAVRLTIKPPIRELRPMVKLPTRRFPINTRLPGRKRVKVRSKRNR